MTLPIPTIEPTRLVSGDTVSWSKALADYPASSGWTLKYILHPLASTGGTKITIVSGASGDDHLVSEAMATTANWAASDYQWTSYVESGTERHTIGSGQLTIDPDPATVSGTTDLRSHARTVLDAIEAVLEGRASKDQEEITLEGQTLKRTPIADLIKLRSVYRSEVDAEEAAARIAAGLGGSGRMIRTRFI